MVKKTLAKKTKKALYGKNAVWGKTKNTKLKSRKGSLLRKAKKALYGKDAMY